MIKVIYFCRSRMCNDRAIARQCNFQPIVLGKAVNLHPLVVIIGVMGGSVILVSRECFWLFQQ